MITPFSTRDAAYYWGGGVLAEDVAGGWWSLHAQTTPAGPEIYSVGQGGRLQGWPKTLKERHVFARADDDGSGRPSICLAS